MFSSDVRWQYVYDIVTYCQKRGIKFHNKGDITFVDLSVMPYAELKVEEYNDSNTEYDPIKKLSTEILTSDIALLRHLAKHYE